MRLCVFEDAGVQYLEPIALTRPAWALRCGASTLLQRQARLLATDEVGALVRPELADLCRLENPSLPINDSGFLQDKALVFVNARWLPPPTARIELSMPHVGIVDGQIAYVVRPCAGPAEFGMRAVQTWLDDCQRTLPQHEAGGAMINFLWDLVDRNGQALSEDWQWFRQTPVSAPAPQGVALLGPADKLVLAESAAMEPFVVIDTRQGPVLIDQGAVVHSFSRLQGPCYIGQETWIVGAKLRGATIGPKCRIGGEVEASIVQGHSNKYHDGFLGHSYLGEWVNLAAGTQTSDLRNDYGEIRVHVAGDRVASRRTKIGSFMGDHSKTGLGALLNVGSSVGVFSTLLPDGQLLPPVVPSFCQVRQGRIEARRDFREMFATAASVMPRRGAQFTDSHSEFFHGLFDSTAGHRHRAIWEAEKHNLRRSV